MSKKMMLLALVVASATFFTLPATVSAQEIHLEPGTGENFSVSGPVPIIGSEREPLYTCESTEGTGHFDSGGSTTGSETLTLTGCHFNALGFTVKCQSEGSLVSNAITTGGTFHLITWVNTSGTPFPAFLLTLTPTKVVCGGSTNTTYSGSVIGTITSPKCGELSKTLSLSFTATEYTQNHLIYTGGEYYLKAATGSADWRKTVLIGTTTIATENPQTLFCT